MKNNTFILTINQNGQSGLIERDQNSARSLKDAEKQVLDFVKDLTYRDKFPIAENPVGVVRMFLQNYMPKLLEHFIKTHPVDVAEFKKEFFLRSCFM